MAHRKERRMDGSEAINAGYSDLAWTPSGFDCALMGYEGVTGCGSCLGCAELAGYGTGTDGFDPTDYGELPEKRTTRADRPSEPVADEQALTRFDRRNTKVSGSEARERCD